LERDLLTSRVIGAAIEVHRMLGPGLLESTYRVCLTEELRLRGLSTRSETTVPLVYKGLRIEHAFRLDLLVEERLIVETKAVAALLPVHSAQVLTYLRCTGMNLGLLLNFNTMMMKDGIVRLVLG
jgi:GxxExxY protein